MATKNRYQYLVSNTLLLLISNLSTRLISFIFLPLYTNYLTRAEYGSIDLINTTVNLLLPVFTLNIYDAVLRFALDKTEDKAHVLSTGMLITAGGSILLLPFLPLFRFQIGLSDYILYIYLVFVGQAFYTLLSNFARAVHKVRLMAGVAILGSLANFIMNYYFVAILHLGVMGYFYGMLIGNSIMIVLLFIGCRCHQYLRWRFPFRLTFKRMLTYCGPMIPNSMIWWTNNSINKFFLANTSQVIQGMYSAASKIPTILNIFVTIFQQAWNLSAFQEVDSEDGEAFFSKVFNLFNAFILGGAVLIIAGSEWIAKPLFKGEFYAAWIYVPLLVFGSYFNAVSAFLGSVFTAKKQTKSLFTSTLLSGIVNVIANLGLIPLFGGHGAAAATAICYVLLWFSRLFSARKLIRLQFHPTRLALSQITLLVAVIAALQQLYPLIALCVMTMGILNRREYAEVVRKLILRRN
jgi:O-antigen/teichoic acid export membrane protein